MRKRVIIFAGIILGGIFLSACGTVKRGTVEESAAETEETAPAKPSRAAAVSETTEQSQVRDFLELAYKDWKGVPYLLGGSGYQGIDCSAFMQVIFEDYLLKKIPRTTKEQLDVGTPVSKSQLKAGDMVFFKTGRRTFHVGVMMDEQLFLHASTTSGVTTSDLSHKFWEETYLTARRVLSDS
ncbi:NlpC/P60 family protein [Gracilimonas mengyeensis]|uniref:Lipoprotein Spr n=1 Tax=Gracilimonas mengyeensis TaxID=1302730 RepID=A0A521FAB5_9BACT|nr:NlpC/P60 family protein [Gracilimonas mengyeensis]SMO93113.1 lipoprotein Spr [Gracilimonas mengyeensis]